MDQLEKNLINSFRLAKTDILKSQNAIGSVNATLAQLTKDVRVLKEKLSKLEGKKTQKVKIRRNYTKAKKYVSANDSKKFHDPSCMFGKNIKPKKRDFYTSKTSALNAGLKPCVCINRI